MTYLRLASSWPTLLLAAEPTDCFSPTFDDLSQPFKESLHGTKHTYGNLIGCEAITLVRTG